MVRKNMVKWIGVLVVAFSMTTVMFAQDGVSIERKNHFSIDPVLPVFGTFQIQYERVLGPRTSLSLSAGYKFSSGSFTIASIDFDRFTSEELDFSGFKFIPEFRWYFQKSHSGLSGFYAGTYIKYQQGITDLAGDYISLSSEVSNILIDASLQSVVIGLEIGYKMRLGNGFFIDFIIAGPGKSFNTLELTEINPVPDAFYEDLENALKDKGIIDLINPDFDINGNQKTKIELPAFRYGIKVGYSF